jgi:hypothetical protein
MRPVFYIERIEPDLNSHEIFNALTDTQWTRIKRAHGHELVWSTRQLLYAILTDFV